MGNECSLQCQYTDEPIVSSLASPMSSRTGPYVFFKFEVMVPAPRFTQRPSTELPTKPSCDLLV